ncbi:hypothetical protein DRQ19_01160 [bacterium]|nr:MAG: hypothetical protein DRQ19_01160 [bacterium]
MEIKYFKDTDTVLVKFNDNEIVDTRDLNDYMLAEFDKDGNIVSITIEHAKEHTDISNFSYEQIAMP